MVYVFNRRSFKAYRVCCHSCRYNSSRSAVNRTSDSTKCVLMTDGHNWTPEELKGEGRVLYLRAFFESQGLKVYAPESYNHQGVDMILYDKKGLPIMVIEVTNYSKTRTPITWKKVRHYADNLNFYDSLPNKPRKWLYVSYLTNLSIPKIAFLKRNNISVYEFGYKHPPREPL